MLISQSQGSTEFRLLPALRYGTVPGAPSDQAGLYLDLLVPEPAANRPVPVVIYLHGGGWRSGQRSEGMYPWLNPMLAAHGFATASVTYRLSQEAPFPAQIHDVKAAIRWLRATATSYGLDAERIGIWGDSAGGQLASLAAVSAADGELEGGCGSPGFSSAVQAVVARCAASDFERVRARWGDDSPILTGLFGGPLAERGDLIRQASPLHHLRPGMSLPPFLFVHGSHDERSHVEQAQVFVQALRTHEADVTFHLIQGGHHNMRDDPTLPWSDEPWTALGREALAFFTKHLG